MGLLNHFKWLRVKGAYSLQSPVRKSGWYLHRGVKENARLGGSVALTKMLKEGTARLYIEKQAWADMVARYRGQPTKAEREQARLKARQTRASALAADAQKDAGRRKKQMEKEQRVAAKHRATAAKFKQRLEVARKKK